MSAVDVFWVLLDEILLVLFGSTLSSIVSFPLTTQGQLSAVGTIVSAGYGFYAELTCRFQISAAACRKYCRICQVPTELLC